MKPDYPTTVTAENPQSIVDSMWVPTGATPMAKSRFGKPAVDRQEPERSQVQNPLLIQEPESSESSFDALQFSLEMLRAEVRQLQEMAAFPGTGTATTLPETFEGVLLSPISCPECGLTLEGFSATGERTQKYRHPFGQSPKLSGQQCSRKGEEYLPPRIILNIIKKKV